MTTTAAQQVAWFKTQVGYREGANNHTKYAALAHQADNQPWCLTFLYAGFNVVGNHMPMRTAYTPSMEAAFRAQRRLGLTPRIGAIYFVYFPSEGRVAHCGIVVAINGDGTITGIEGNTNTDGSSNGNGVYYKRRADLRSGNTGIRSYGYPYYAASTPASHIPSVGHKPVGVIAAMQKVVHVPADGQWGPVTDLAMRSVLDYTNRTAPSIAYLQARVGAHVDGIWGPKSKVDRSLKVKALQKLMGGIPVTGINNDVTWKRLAQYRAHYYKH